MRSSKSFGIITFLALTIVFFSAATSAVSQDKGNGGKNKGGGDSRMDRGNDNNRGQKMERGDRGNGRGNERRDDQMRQAQREQPQYRVMQQWPNDRGRGRNNGKDRHEKQERNFEKDERKFEKIQRKMVERTWAQQFPARERRSERRRDDDRGVVFNPYPYYEQYPRPKRWPYQYGYKNYGQYRSNQVHRRNERRKADREYDQYRLYDYDDDRRYAYWNDDRDDHDNWRDNILRMVVTQVFSGGGNHYEPRYVYDRGYVSAYEPVYRNEYYVPRYTSYSPYEQYRYSTIYVGDPYYSNNGLGDLGGSLFNDSSLGGFVSQIFRQLLASGYDDGYQAAQYVRSNGYDPDRYYSDPYDPYVYENVTFDNIDYNPYSSLGENQRYLSEGYELGYQDGLRAAARQNEFEGGNGVDLVSAILGNIL